MASVNPGSSSVPLLSGADLVNASRAAITQGLSAGSTGSIFYPDQILAVEVPPATADAPADPRIAAWASAYRFLILPVAVAVQASPGTAPRSVIVKAGFRNSGQPARQPIIIDVFPATGFKAGPLTGSASASVGVGSDLKFGGPVPASADASVKAALSYTYAPGFANVQSGFASTSCFWQFAATQSEQPVGNLALKLTVAIPRTVTAASLAMDFDIVAAFGGWFGDELRAAFVAEVLLPAAA